MVSGNHSGILRFGPFEADLETGELRKDGVKLALQVQPFQVLAILLKNAGGLVTREQLQSQIWPRDTFVDFDHALNTAITKIRLALGDDAEHPTYIETLPRRGYRFIATVETTRTEIPNSGAADARGGKTRAHWLWAIVAAATREIRAPGFSKRKFAILATVTLVLAIAVAALLSLSRKVPKINDSSQITNDGLPKDLRLVTDGARIYFTERRNDIPSLAQVFVGGGETVRTATALQYREIFDISPTHSELLVNVGYSVDPVSPDLQLWSMPVLAGSAHRIGDIHAHDACWAPDGDHIAYANGKDLFIAKPDGTEAKKVASLVATASWIRFSPDGERLRFSVSVGDLSHFPSLWEVTINGGKPRRLTDGCCGSWSPDGRYYYFWNWGLWVLAERRSVFHPFRPRPEKLTTDVLALQAPIPSIDGKKLFVIGVQGRGELLGYDRHTRRFVPFLGGISASEADISRDGQWVTYTTFPDYTIWRSKLDGSERLQLTFPPINGHEPRWSPDGRQIVFNDFPSKLFVVSASGGLPQQLMPEDTPDLIGAATWSPDGSSIVFGKWKGSMNSIANYRLDLRSKQVSKLPGSEGLHSVRLSPNGRYISAFRINKPVLMLFDTKTETWSELGTGNYSFNSWSHDGQFVYVKNIVDADRGKESQGAELARIRISDHKLEHVLSLIDVPQGGAGWISLNSDDTPILMRDKSTQEIYSFDLRIP